MSFQALRDLFPNLHWLLVEIALVILLVLKLAKLIVSKFDDLRKLWHSRSARSGLSETQPGASPAPTHREGVPSSVHDYCI